MDKYEVNFETDDVVTYGKLVVCFKEDRMDWIIPGTYEFSSPIAHNMSNIIEMNDKNSTLIRLPNQRGVIDLLKGLAFRIRDDKWFTDPEKSKSEFSQLERGIAKAMHRFRLNDNSMIGLLGELTVLYKMLEHCKTEFFNVVLDSWQGHSSKSRDFIFSESCLEVKTTREEKSIHHINNLNQVDSTDDDGGETRLFIASLGIVDSEDDTGVSLSDLVKKLILKISDEEKKKDLLKNIKSFGVNSIGYDHNLMSDWSQFNEKFIFKFERYYDMSDENIKVPRHKNFESMSHLMTKTVKFMIELPNVVVEGENPKDFTQFFECINNEKESSKTT